MLVPLLDFALAMGCVAAGVGVISQRHLRWWIARFTSPYAPVPCIVGDITGQCGEEPLFLNRFGCQDCGWLVSPVAPGIFSAIAAACYAGVFGLFMAESGGGREIHRTEGSWLTLTALGLQLCAVLFAVWGQRVVCPVRHVWHCDCHLELAKASADLDVMQVQATPDEEPRQGLPHLLVGVARRYDDVKARTMTHVNSAKAVVHRAVLHATRPPTVPEYMLGPDGKPLPQYKVDTRHAGESLVASLRTLRTHVTTSVRSIDVSMRSLISPSRRVLGAPDTAKPPSARRVVPASPPRVYKQPAEAAPITVAEHTASPIAAPPAEEEGGHSSPV